MIKFIRQLLWLCLAISLHANADASAEQAQQSELRELAKGVHWLPGEFVSGKQPDGNTVILSAPDGLIVFDSGRHPQHSARILAAARDTERPIVAIINSHWHLDHVSGNPALRAAFPKLQIHASSAIDEALVGFLSNYRKQLQQALQGTAPDAQKEAWQAEIARIDSGPQLRPTRPVLRNETRNIGGRALQLHLQPDAVSGGDVWVFDPTTRILLAGDLVTLPAPLFDTACVSRWQQALQALHAVDFDWLVPGHGAPLTKPQLARYIGAFDNLVACAASDAEAASCAADWQKDLGDLLPADQTALATQLLDYYVGQVLRGEDRPSNCSTS